MLLGALVALSPFVGLPYSWLLFLLPILGLSIMVTAFLMRRKDALPKVAYDEETSSPV